MLKYGRIDISEEIDINKTNSSKDCDICHYWNFFDKNFRNEPYLCNDCYNLMQKAMNDVAIVSAKRIDYRIYLLDMSKTYAINIMKNSKLNEKVDYIN